MSAKSQPQKGLPAAAPRPAFGLYLGGSLLMTLVLGSSLGLLNLIRIGAGASVPFSHIQIHAHTQILGFVALFIMGISIHALPRILSVHAAPAPPSRTIFWLMAGGVLLRDLGQPFNAWDWGRVASLLSGPMELASGVLFSVFVFTLLSRSGDAKYGRRDPFALFLAAGSVELMAALAVSAGQSVWLAAHPETQLPARGNDLFYFLSLYGFVLAWILAFAGRVVSMFLGTGSPRRGTPQAALALQAAGCVAEIAGAAQLALVLVSLATLVHLAGHGFLWRRPRFPVFRAPGEPTAAIRAAFGMAGLWAVLSIGMIAADRFTSFPADNIWWNDASRHVFTVGFLMLLIVGMSFRIVPVFSGKRLWSPAMARATYALLVGGVAMRLLEYPAVFDPQLFPIGSWMGVPVYLAYVLFAYNLIRTLRRRPTGELPVVD